MAVKIRLMRIGKTKQPSYRVVVKEARTPRSGKYIEQLGFYNPLSEPADVRLDEERVRYWLGVGAQPTDRVRTLISKNTSIEIK
ncbi:MAG: 30S ribosomal protein S16 [bacterium]